MLYCLSFIVGGLFGMFIMILAVASKHDSECEEKLNKNLNK